MANPADIDPLVQLARSHYGRVDGVVNNSGGHPDILQDHARTSDALTAPRLDFDPTDAPDRLDLPDAAWHDDFNMMGLLCIRRARAVTPYMRQQGGGTM